MAYIPSYQTLRDHPKLKRLARRLSISEVTAIGHLHLFWWWAMDYAPGGSLLGRDVLDIAIAGRWDGDENQFAAALIECGFIDDAGAGDLRVHDWDEYGGKYQEKLEKDRERKRSAREVQRLPNGSPTEIRRTSNGNPKDGATRREEERREEEIPSKDGADKPPKSLPSNGEAQAIVKAFCQEAGISAPASYSRAVGQAAQMVKAGITAIDVPSLYGFAAEWKGTADLGLMLSSIDRWRAKPRASPPGSNLVHIDGQTFTSDQIEEWRVRKARGASVSDDRLRILDLLDSKNGVAT